MNRSQDMRDKQTLLGKRLFALIVLDNLMELFPELSHDEILVLEEVKQRKTEVGIDEYLQIAIDYNRYGFAHVKAMHKRYD